MARYNVGERLRSRVSNVQVVVVRAADTDKELFCDGVSFARDVEDFTKAASLANDGSKVDMGKRYEDDAKGSVKVLRASPSEGRLTFRKRATAVEGTQAATCVGLTYR